MIGPVQIIVALFAFLVPFLTFWFLGGGVSRWRDRRFEKKCREWVKRL